MTTKALTDEEVKIINRQRKARGLTAYTPTEARRAADTCPPGHDLLPFMVALALIGTGSHGDAPSQTAAPDFRTGGGSDPGFGGDSSAPAPASDPAPAASDPSPSPSSSYDSGSSSSFGGGDSGGGASFGGDAGGAF